MSGQIDCLPSDELHVWIFDLDRPRNDEHVLSQHERKRAERFQKIEDQRRFKAAHTRVRQILGRYLKEPPLSLLFGNGTAGKPFLQAPGRPRRVAFNLAHSGQYGLLAVTRDREVGVDIEIERDVGDLVGMAQQIMSPSEFQCFELTAPHAGEILFELWTRKEALLKAVGTGFSTDPRDVDLGLESVNSVTLLRGMVWSIVPLRPLLPLRAAAAVNGDLPVLRVFDFDAKIDYNNFIGKL